MKFHLQRLFAALAALTITALASAQQSKNVTVILQDSGSGDPLAFATVSITKDGAKTPAKYILSDAKGKAVLEGVSSGKYTLKAELMSYKAYTQAIEVKSASVDLGTVKVAPDQKVLDAASVSAVGNNIIVKKDTVEYNAAAFMTSDNDMLIDLLKKMPGMEVSDDGSVTFNGQSISKITIQGRTFFLDDPSLATKNIPSKMVNKLKVINKKSEQAEFTGIDDGQEETVIDLSVHKGMMNGLFGNLMAGAGHDVPENNYNGNGDFRYQGSGFIGDFTEKNQISLILNGGNTNNRGAADMAGSMMNGMRGGGGGMGMGMGGFGGGNGITTSWMAGLNGNVTPFKGKMKLDGNYLYNGSQNKVKEISSQTTYNDGFNLLDDKNGYSTTNTDGHRFGFRLDHKFSDNTSILFQPQFNFGSGDFTEWSDFKTKKQVGDDITNLTDGFTLNTGNNNSKQANGSFLLRQKLGLPGRTLTFRVNYSFSDNDTDGLNQSLKNVYQEDGGTVPDIINQRYKQNQKNSSLSGNLTYTEPLGAGFYVEGNYQLSWNRNKSTKNTYNSADNTGFDASNHFYNPAGEIFDADYSSRIVNRYINQTAGVNFMYQQGKANAQVGISVKPSNTHNETNGKVYDNKVTNWAPTARIRFDLGENSNIRVNYRGNSSQPSTSQLMSVPDNTNPMNISFGNPYLKPYFSHSFSADYRVSNRETFSSLNVSVSGGVTSNPIINATWNDPKDGVRYSFPVNGPSSKNGSLRLFFNSPIAKSKFSISTMTNGSYSQSSSFVSTNKLDITPYYDGTNFDYELFHTNIPDLAKSDFFSLNKTESFNAMQNLRLTYRSDKTQISLSGRTNMRKSWYTVAAAQTKMTFSNQVSASFNFTLPGGISLISDASYNWYNNYSVPQDKEFIVNAEINKLLFKNQMTVAIKGYDLLNEAKNLSISDTMNYHKETWNNTLGRYLILSLTWRFGTFGGTKGFKMGGRGGKGGPAPGGPGPGGFGGGRPPMM